MTARPERPLFTRTVGDPTTFQPEAGAAYLFGLFEQRSEHVESWRANADGVRFVKFSEREPLVVATDLAGHENVSLRSRDELHGFLRLLATQLIYIDITGLSHNVWAPLIKVAVEEGFRIKVVYVEPADYKLSANPVRGEIFDLSEKINGIAPLPLFATLAEPEEERVCFVPLLGFEGARFSYVSESVDPPGAKTIPIIGVPGFRAEYPFYTYHGNEPKLQETRAYREVRYARANCPFSVFYVLTDIFERFRGSYFKIAPIGTKPHSLGAVLRSIVAGADVEIVYDHPKRKPGRTTGASNCLVYAVSEFLDGNPALRNLWRS